MTEISFGSTYRIPLVEQKITPAKRDKLKQLVSNGKYIFSYPKRTDSFVKVSMKQEDDADFEKQLGIIGFKVFQKFDRHEVPEAELVKYLKEQLDARNYRQFGKQMKAKNKR